MHWHDESTGERDASHKVLAPSALAGRVALFRGSQPPETSRCGVGHTRSSSTWESPLAGASIARAVLRLARSRSGLGCTPAAWGVLRLPKRVMHRRVPLQRDVPLPATRESWRLGRDFLPTALVGFGPSQCSPGRHVSGRFRPSNPPAVPWLVRSDGIGRRIGRPKRTLRAESGGRSGTIHRGSWVSSMQASSGFTGHAGLKPRLPWALPLSGFRPPRWCVRTVSKIRPGRRPPESPPPGPIRSWVCDPGRTCRRLFSRRQGLPRSALQRLDEAGA